MSYTNVYPSRINWENEPSIASPINATNLNKMDYALYQIDQTLETWDVTKANQSDLLLSVKSIDYDTDTGVFVFTWQNGTTKTVDLNIEKIPVSFSMSPQGVITMTTDDGTTYTADVGSLIKTYTFTDSSEIDFTVTTDASGNKTITAGIVAGSITGDKLEPNYLANCQSAANSASGSATAADGSAEDAEAWAVGQRDGTDVPSTDPTYHNNAKWYAEHGTGSSLAGLTDTNITSPTDGQVLTYDSASQKWINDDPSAGGGSKIIITTIDTGLYSRPVTISDGTTTLTGAFDNTGEATFEGVTLTGSLTVSSSTSGGTTTTMTIVVPYFGNYEFELTDFEATIIVTYTTGATCSCVGQGESYTATSNPQTFTVHHAGTYTITVSKDGETKTETVTITTDGQSESITVDLIPDGSTVTPTDSVATWLKCAGITDKSYTTLSQVMGDSVTFNALLGDSNANKYMARSTTWASTLCADQYAMCMIGQYDVCCDALLGNSTWASAIGSSTYMEYVLDTKVPKMTSNTTPSGVCSASYANTGQEAYKAFDNNSSTLWGSYGTSNPNVNQWVGYEYTTATVIRAFEFDTLYDTNLRVKNFKIQGSNDGFSSDIHDLYTGATESDSSASAKVIGFFDNSTAYKYYRLYVIDNWSSNTNIAIAVISLQFYGRASSTEKIHGANEEVAYYLDGATQVPISYPSTLEPGTYTFGSTVAKNPDSLSNDYTKQIRITPNTVEVVLRPDNSVYWYGSKVGEMITKSGSSETYTAATVTENTNSITISVPSTSSIKQSGYVSSIAMSGTKTKAIVNSAQLPEYNASSTVQVLSFVNDTASRGTTICYSGAVSTPTLFEDSSVQNAAQVGFYIQGRYTGTTSCDFAALWRE